MSININHSNFNRNEAIRSLEKYEVKISEEKDKNIDKYVSSLGISTATLVASAPVIAGTALFGAPALALVVPAIPVFFVAYIFSERPCCDLGRYLKNRNIIHIKNTESILRESNQSDINLYELKNLFLLDNGRYCKKQVGKMNFQQLRILKTIHGEVKFTKWISKYNTPEVELWKKIMSIPKSEQPEQIVQEIQQSQVWQDGEVREEVNRRLREIKSTHSSYENSDNSSERKTRNLSIGGKRYQVDDLEFSQNCEGILKDIIEMGNELTFTDDEDTAFAPLYVKFANGDSIEWNPKNLIEMLNFCNKYSQTRLLSRLDRIMYEKYIQHPEWFAVEDKSKLFFIPEMTQLRVAMLDWAEQTITKDTWQDFAWAAKLSNNKELTDFCIDYLISKYTELEDTFFEKINYIYKFHKNEASDKSLEMFISRILNNKVSDKNLLNCFLIARFLNNKEVMMKCIGIIINGFYCHFSAPPKINLESKNEYDYQINLLSIFYENTDLSDSEKIYIRSEFRKIFNSAYYKIILSKKDYEYNLSQIEKIVGKLDSTD